MKYYIKSDWGWFIYDEETNKLSGKIGGHSGPFDWTLDDYDKKYGSCPWWDHLNMLVSLPIEYFVEIL